MKINLWPSRIFFHTLGCASWGTRFSEGGDTVRVVCKQGVILTITIQLGCPFVDVEHHWKGFSLWLLPSEAHIFYTLVFFWQQSRISHCCSVFSGLCV